MQVHVTLLAIAVILVVSIESKPTWPSFYVNSYTSQALSVQPQLLQYQDTYSPYYLYNVHSDLHTIPTTILANGKSTIPHLSSYNFYYGTPVYDLRFPLNPIYPVLKPGELPKPTPPSTTTMKPTEGSEDGIEKLDMKVEPEKETKKPMNNNENQDANSITVDSI